MLFSTVAITAFAAVAAAVPVKRGFGGRATYYATGLGACGEVSTDSDFIVALNAPQYGDGYPGTNCFKQIQISANGKTATAKIMDKCPGCGYGDLDMSPALFNHFADPSVGVFQMSWDFGAGSAPEPKPEPKPTSTYVAPTTSSTPQDTPTSTYVAPTSTYVAPTTTSEAPSTSDAPSSSVAPVQAKIESTSAPVSSTSAWVASSSSSASESTSSSATSTSSAPVPTITVNLGSGNLSELCEAVAQMGKLVIVGASLANGTNVTVENTTLTI